jgi:FkbM family methyltransferase
MRLIGDLRIDLVLDVGANVGQFALELHRHGYPGRIVSFEPLSAAFEALSRAASRDSSWDARRYGIGDVDGRAQMNVAANWGASSSLLASTPLNDRAAPEARYVGSEQVEIRRLDPLVRDDLAHAAATYLKVDVQGAEQQVLEGAPETMSRASLVQLELSLYPLYVGAPTYHDLIHFMEELDFILAGLEPGFTDRSNGRLLQVDALFVAGATSGEPSESTTDGASTKLRRASRER